MKTITIPEPADETIVAQLGSLYETFKDVKFGEKLEFDVCLLKWACPLLILPISAYIKETGSGLKINECKIKPYLDKMSFPNGVNSISAFQRHKTFIPISVLNKEEEGGREGLVSLFEEKIYKVLGDVSGARGAVWYPMSELITNIFEHSKKEFGFVFGQFYPKKEYLDICIVDCGRGFANTYKQEKELNLSDEQAIIEAMKGNSAKKDKERGYGIWTSKRVVCEALKGGGFILISGSCALVSTERGDRLVPLPNFYWQGAIISYRIPRPTGSIDISKYIE